MAKSLMRLPSSSNSALNGAGQPTITRCWCASLSVQKSCERAERVRQKHPRGRPGLLNRLRQPILLGLGDALSADAASHLLDSPGLILRHCGHPLWQAARPSALRLPSIQIIGQTFEFETTSSRGFPLTDFRESLTLDSRCLLVTRGTRACHQVKQPGCPIRLHAEAPRCGYELPACRRCCGGATRPCSRRC